MDEVKVMINSLRATHCDSFIGDTTDPLLVTLLYVKQGVREARLHVRWLDA